MTEIYNNVTEFFQDGGLFIYPISVVLVIGLAIAFERWVFLNREKWRNRRAFNDFLPLLRTTDMDKMQMYSRESQAPVDYRLWPRHDEGVQAAGRRRKLNE